MSVPSSRTAVDQAFNALDQSLNLDPKEREQAQERHNAVREVLKKAGVITGGFLQGSFARKTMLAPLNDVDTVNVLAERLREDLIGPGGVQQAFDLFQDAVESHWPDARFDVGEEGSAAKALRVAFPDCGFTVDLVAAFETDSELVLIGDREEDTWMLSRTRVMNRLISERNQATGGLFVHQVRILKSLKNVHAKLDFTKGILYETLAYNAIHAAKSHKQAVSDVLVAAQQMVATQVMDPTGENDLTEKWSSQERKTAISEFTRLAAAAQEALRFEAAGDEDAALDVWHLVLGSNVFAPPTRSAKAVLSSWHAGSVSSSGRPSTAPVGAVPPTPGRSWRHRE